MLNDPKAVANYFLDCAKASGQPLSPMKLNKLVYLAHGWTLGLTGEPLITEYPEAWRYGPVIPSLYHDFKEFGAKPIDRYAFWLERDDCGAPRSVAPFLGKTTDELDIEIIKKVWNEYKRYSATQLSNLTHKNGTPWENTWNNGGGKERLGQNIPDDLIKKHYEHLVNAADQGDKMQVNA